MRTPFTLKGRRGDLALDFLLRGRPARFDRGLARPTKICISKEFPNISKLLFAVRIDINRLRAARIWNLQAFPNFYLAETGDINALRSKKFGKQQSLKNLRSLQTPPPSLTSLRPLCPKSSQSASARRRMVTKDAMEKPDCPETVSLNQNPFAVAHFPEEFADGGKTNRRGIFQVGFGELARRQRNSAENR